MPVPVWRLKLPFLPSISYRTRRSRLTPFLAHQWIIFRSHSLEIWLKGHWQPQERGSICPYEWTALEKSMSMSFGSSKQMPFLWGPGLGGSGSPWVEGSENQSVWARLWLQVSTPGLDLVPYEHLSAAVPPPSSCLNPTSMEAAPLTFLAGKILEKIFNFCIPSFLCPYSKDIIQTPIVCQQMLGTRTEYGICLQGIYMSLFWGSLCFKRFYFISISLFWRHSKDLLLQNGETQWKRQRENPDVLKSLFPAVLRLHHISA